MKKIAIIGCGFSGTMTAVHLIKNATQPFELILIGDHESFNTGIAYNPSSKRQLLNVIASRMSAFQDRPDHFLDWAAALEEYSGVSRDTLANSYLPRYLYGEYLRTIWRQTVQSPEAQKVQITVRAARVLDMAFSGDEIVLVLSDEAKVTAQYCVIATGNQLPRDPAIPNMSFFRDPHYFRDPWDGKAVRNPDPSAPVLVLGNGLTMADTVIGLVENGFTNEIHTISPHGFTILPNNDPGITYTAIAGELHDRLSLSELVRLISKHIKLARQDGLSAGPVIDAIRPYTLVLWRNLTIAEKKMFLSRMRSLWDAARHRMPISVYENIRKLSDEGKLHLHAGKLTGITQSGHHVSVNYFDRDSGMVRNLVVSAVINCTGPATEWRQQEGGFLDRCQSKGTLFQDELKLGIQADPVTFEVYDGQNKPRGNVFAIGSLLKGVLWESTAVKELREQASIISRRLVYKMQESSGS
jgi:uncharacterized NAD(P)/FAD-binding protein YdhS